MSETKIKFPEKGAAKDDVLKKMAAMRDEDARWREGKTFSLVFYAGDEVLELLKEAYTMFMSENGLNPSAFPSLRRFEAEVISMTAGMLGGDAEVRGNMTSGGTESILMAVKTAREWARENLPHVKIPEMVLPVTAHPAFDKAAHYFNVKAVHTPVGKDYRADVDAMEKAVTKNTILLLGSAAQYAHGVVDPIRDIAALAKEKGLLCHVDACIGGFVLPFAKKLGYAIPDFDFRVTGVTSISVDLHKYAYSAKGASVILYRNKEIRRHQFFVYTNWPGGIYGSPTMTGTRPGGAIAAAWAMLNYLGEEGYLQIVDTVMKTTKKFIEGIHEIDGIYVVGEPHMSIIAIGSDTLDVYEVGDEMRMHGWHIDKQQFPPTLHLTVTFAHAEVADKFLSDLKESVAIVKKFGWRKASSYMQMAVMKNLLKILPEKWVSALTKMAGAKGDGVPKRTAAMYGMMGALPNKGDVKELVLDFIEKFTDAQK